MELDEALQPQTCCQENNALLPKFEPGKSFDQQQRYLKMPWLPRIWIKFGHIKIEKVVKLNWYSCDK